MRCSNLLPWIPKMSLQIVCWQKSGIDWGLKVPWEYNWCVYREFHTFCEVAKSSLEVGESPMTPWVLTSLETQNEMCTHRNSEHHIPGHHYNDWGKALVSSCLPCHLPLCVSEEDRCLINALRLSGRQPHSCSVRAPEAVVWSEICQAKRTQPSVDSASQPAMSHHFGFFIFQDYKDRGRVLVRGGEQKDQHTLESRENWIQGSGLFIFASAPSNVSPV